jgi:RNA polymerase sigma-70 factor (ECF subfamily)
MLSEEDLIRAHKLYYGPLMGFAVNMLKDRHKAEDFVQEAFVRLWEARGTSCMQSAKSYLFVGLANRAKNELRDLKRRTKHHEKCINEEELEYNILEQQSVKYHMLSLLYEAIEKLSPQQKKVILACLQMDNTKSRAEIAEALKISLYTVKEHRAKAYEFLRKYCLPRVKYI